MAKLTYKSLYELVKTEIDKAGIYNTKTLYKNQLSRSSIIPVSSFGANDVNSAAIISAIQQFLTEAVPSFIKQGLTVTAKTPESAIVTIAAGSGAAAGYFYELEEDTDVTIPFDATSEVFYLNLFQDRILVEKTSFDNKLTVAKIVVPNPNVTSRVRDTSDGSDDAYIINYTEYKLRGDANGKFEEDTVELLRDNIGAILADNLIGNIRLTEDLKIINTQGTLELDSSEMRLKDTDGDVLAKFNKNGSFYYNSDGVEVARFTVDDARIGNILITKNSVQSADFISESKGFKIQDDGYAEFENVRIRGRISSSVFETDKISAVGGKLYIGNASVIATQMSALDSATLTVEDSLFSVGDVLRIKDGLEEEYLQVTDISSAPTYVVTRDLANQYTSNNNPTWAVGTAIVSTGNPNSGENPGFILLDAVSQYSPFIDIANRESSSPSDYSTKVRLGNLEGISDTCFHESGGNLQGYGLYADNVYLKGKLAASIICSSDLYSNNIYSSVICGSCLIGTNCIIGATIKTSESGQRLEMNNSGLYAYDSNGDLIAKLQGSGICFIDPDCTSCYSYLDAGALKFHHPYGDIPYAKQIKSGSAVVGTTVCLCQWYCQPEIMIGIASMRSYDSDHSADCQQWCVYYDNLVQYNNGGSDFGWKFDVHGSLSLSGGLIDERIHNCDFCQYIVTCNNVCSAIVKMNFQLFTHGAAPATMCYGCLCYHLRWRPYVSGGAGSWTCCDYTYTQPHSTCTEMKTTQTVCHTIDFGSGGDDWEVEAVQDGNTWHDSGITSGSIACNYWCCTLADCSWAQLSGQCSSGTCTATCHFEMNFPAAPALASDIFCQCITYNICCNTGVPALFTCNRLLSGCACSHFNDNAGYSCQINTFGCHTCTSNLDNAVNHAALVNCYCSTFCFDLAICAFGGGGFLACARVGAGCIRNLTQQICYYTYSGGADNCCLRKLYSTIETTTDSTILDSTGSVNWLAVAYS